MVRHNNLLFRFIPAFQGREVHVSIVIAKRNIKYSDKIPLIRQNCAFVVFVTHTLCSASSEQDYSV